MRRLVLLTALAVVALAGTARADYHSVISDCAAHGQLLGHYSHRDLRQALSHLPADVDEYTNCRQIITDALATSSGGGRGFRGFTQGQPKPGVNPLTTATPQERQAVQQAAVHGSSAVHLTDASGHATGAVIQPGQRRTAASITDVPAPLLVAAILLGAAMLTAVLSRLVRRGLSRWGH